LSRTGRKKGLITAAAALAISFAAPAGATTLPTAAVPVSKLSFPSGQAAGVQSTQAAGVQSRQHRVKVLMAALDFMRDNYQRLAHITPGPQDILDYNIGDLWRRDIDGFGTSVAVIEGWDFPGINNLVAGFDRQFHLPNPQIQTIFPSGPLPKHCPRGMVRLGSYGSCNAWKGELALDVVTVHLIAPYAKIVISATPADSEITDEAAFNVAPPEMMRALEYISRHHLANAISISDGTGETTYLHGQEEILAQNSGELAAAAAGIPVMIATGDCGVLQNLATASSQCGATSTTPDTATWDDSPWTTAVGGSIPNFSSSGVRRGPDPLIPFEGAGLSSVFPRPGYQNGVASVTHSTMRSVPDITMDAQDGTSESAPMFAGVLALATQLNHANVGPVNPALYQILGPAGVKAGVVDVVKGNNSAGSVPGFATAKGFDVASGWGTIDASRFVPALVRATRATQQEAAARRLAAAGLRQLEHNVQLFAPHTVHNSVYLLDQGFLPRHPVFLYVDGHKVAKLIASPLGYVTYMIDPVKLKLPAGHHVATLTSMLITTTGTFSTG
jgi:subtilase family serine protease